MKIKKENFEELSYKECSKILNEVVPDVVLFSKKDVIILMQNAYIEGIKYIITNEH